MQTQDHRFKHMSPNQDWTDVWPTAASFKQSSVLGFLFSNGHVFVFQHGSTTDSHGLSKSVLARATAGQIREH